MRVETLKPPPSGLIPTGWIVAIVGTTVLMVLAIFMLIDYPLLPDLPQAALDRRPFDLPALRMTASGAVLIDGQDVAPSELAGSLSRIDGVHKGVRFNLTPQTPWVAVRQAIGAARAAGAQRIKLSVRKGPGRFGVIVLKANERLPDLPADANAQAFIDSLADRRSPMIVGS